MTREEAIKWVNDRMCWGRGTFTENHPPNIDECWEVGCMAMKALSEKRMGEWVEREDWNGDNYYDCSLCGESFVLIDGTPSMNLYHYCPNCGAKMKGENNENPN